jgi:oligoendopeptidase F
MAFKLTASEDAKLQKLKADLTEAYTEVETAVNDYNEHVQELHQSVDIAMVSYNATLSELRYLVNEISGDKRSEFDEKSDAWKEGDNGSAADEWISTWEGTDLEDATISYPDQLELEFDNHGDIDLPSEP